ncbi:hypothetical protein CEUSTIGMA_g2510.t1 [Chlamydomonas eustigma]|uniref:type II protein arginine methyltransferase n=1 Tax=Chlamydomonas eustigma TaxID=1157962 RepID=A0A250WWC4_9CHLO|nr:hypothetical protein CEUSTIGMA_g2510.t1 [Chlamydomonas eustigma]|eukprot:GAX75066.1 hypothetical protein CEUSTIGMA_g2510.t1 [Chlamydomonas eustigma]
MRSLARICSSHVTHFLRNSLFFGINKEEQLAAVGIFYFKSFLSTSAYISDQAKTKLLLRDFIHQSLYHPTLGYFNRDVPVVGHLEGPINYWKVYCQEEWNIMINKKYKELQVSFLTPVELFTPWYGYILARHMLEHRKHNLGMEGQPLVIYEIGGGNGTLARDVLDWLRDNRRDVYEQTCYTCVEISTRLAAEQYESVVVKAGHRNQFKMLKGSALDRGTWGGRDWSHSFILAMEVLDNLPHDRVFRSSEGSAWRQTSVGLCRENDRGSMESGPWQELVEELSDPLIQRCLEAVYKPPTFEQRLDQKFNKLLDFILAKEGPPEAPCEVLFLPTGCMTLMETLHDVRPNHSIIAADFDYLPDVKIPGKNAPLVSEKVNGINKDHDTLYVPWGKADIFFPTDFEALGQLYRDAGQHVWRDQQGIKIETAHYQQGAVMKRYKEMVHTATISAFNPMIDDFLNARFFMGDTMGRVQHGSAPGAVESVGSVSSVIADSADSTMASPVKLDHPPHRETAALHGGNPLSSSSRSATTFSAASEGISKRSDIGGSTTSVVQPAPLNTAAAAAAKAAKAAKARLLRQQRQQQQQQQGAVLPDEIGLPAWARDKLLKLQQVSFEEKSRKDEDKGGK